MSAIYNLSLEKSRKKPNMQQETTEKLLSLWSHLYTIWLFTFSDLKTIVAPETAFGILCALSGPILTTNESPYATKIFIRLPLVSFWTWINLLPFVIDNQRRPASIQEDTINKPWRPMPSQRITMTLARRWMQIFYLAAFLTSGFLGAVSQCIGLMFLGFLYNELGGADHSCIIRNLINSFGFICYGSGTSSIASNSTLSRDGWNWFLVIGMVVFTTVHTQDMYDQAGDNSRSRKTIPLVIGDFPARITIALSVGFWSLYCPAFWNMSAKGYLVPRYMKRS